MIEYRVDATDTAVAAIVDQARYIAVEQRRPENAAAGLERVWDAVDSLESMPRRYKLSEEDAYVDYEMRQMIVGSLGIRHERRRPQVDDVSMTQPVRSVGDTDGCW